MQFGDYQVVDGRISNRLHHDIEKLRFQVGQIGICQDAAVNLSQVLFERLANLSLVQFDQLPALHTVVDRYNSVKTHRDGGLSARLKGKIVSEVDFAGSIDFSHGGLVANQTYDACVQADHDQHEHGNPVAAKGFQHIGLKR